MKESMFKELLSSVDEGGSILQGRKKASRSFRIDEPNVPAIRHHLGLTQERFAALLGISVATLRNWEQGRRRPEGAARVLLCVAARNPRAVLEAVNA